MVARGKDVGEREEEVREVERYKLPVAKQLSQGFEMYSVGNIGNNCVISLYGDRW